LVETRKLPGISLTDSVEISKRIEQRLRAFPEIADVVIKIGRPDFATEAMGINEGDTYLLLKPADQWHRFHSKDELIEAIDKELAKIPGLSYNFTQPMAMRVDETVSGVKADLAIKIFGDDFDTLDLLSQQVLRAVSGVRGAADALPNKHLKYRRCRCPKWIDGYVDGKRARHQLQESTPLPAAMRAWLTPPITRSLWRTRPTHTETIARKTPIPTSQSS
jgi:Cu/Ag efflux pump CusA